MLKLDIIQHSLFLQSIALTKICFSQQETETGLTQQCQTNHIYQPSLTLKRRMLNTKHEHSQFFFFFFFLIYQSTKHRRPDMLDFAWCFTPHPQAPASLQHAVHCQQDRGWHWSFRTHYRLTVHPNNNRHTWTISICLCGYKSTCSRSDEHSILNVRFMYCWTSQWNKWSP